MEAIVHIGLPKTGSTAIQHYLAEHARVLSQRGIHYETGSWLGDTNHFKLPLAVLRSAGLELDAQSAAIASWLGQPEELPAHGAQALAGVEKIAELNDIRQVIFSTEFLSFWLQTPREFAALHDLMTRLFSSVRYVVYFRAPVGHAESDYNQHIKTGMTDDLASFARAYPEKITQWADRVLMLADCAGPEAIDLRKFDRAAFEGGSLIEDFCNAINMGDLPNREFPAANETLNISGVRLLRAINRALPSDVGTDQAHALRQELLPLIRQITAGGSRVSMPDALAREVHAASLPALEKVSSVLCPDAPLEFPAPMNQPETSEIDTPDTPELGMMARLLIEAVANAQSKATITGLAEQTSKTVIARARAVSRDLGARFQGRRQ